MQLFKDKKKTMFTCIGAYLILCILFGDSSSEEQEVQHTSAVVYEEQVPLTTDIQPQEDMAADGLVNMGDMTIVDTEMEWIIMWYLCGSDLETDGEAGTRDLYELMSVELPSNVGFYIQTGGAREWHNEFVDSKKTQRFLYDHTGLSLLEELPMANMGEADTFADFLAYGKEHFPSKKVMVNLWNHGGGSISGVAFDENYRNDALTLEELHMAFTSVYEGDSENPPIDMVGFDACLMATLETACILYEVATYMVASAEIEPGCGWDYTGMAQALAAQPDLSPLELGKAICVTYYEACDEWDLSDNITLSVVNIGKIPKVYDAFHHYGMEALGTAIGDTGFFASLGRIANNTENYGRNDERSGYTNMMDLAHLAIQSNQLMPDTCKDLYTAVEDCVEYKVNGFLRNDSFGLACYYSYDKDQTHLDSYKKLLGMYSIPYLYEYNLTGTLSEGGWRLIGDYYGIEIDDDFLRGVVQVASFETMNFNNAPVSYTEDGDIALELGAEASEYIERVGFELFYYDEEGMLFLGNDNDLYVDWDHGIFYDNFRGVWGSLDGSHVYMELSYVGEGYNSYTIPILLNGESYNLEVIYDFGKGEYFIQGARKPITEEGMVDKNLRSLYVGDVIEPIWYLMFWDDEETLIDAPSDSIVVTENTRFYDEYLGDGVFLMHFTMQDAMGNVANSEMFGYEIVDGEIWKYVLN